MQRSLEEQRGTLVGRIRISAPHTLGQHLLGPIVGDFLATHPGCDVILDLSNRRVDLVEERFDFVARVGMLEGRELILRQLGQVHAGLYRKPKARRGKHTIIQRPEDLDGCDVGLLRSDDVKRPIFNLFNDAGDTVACAVRIRMTVLNPWVLSQAAQQTHLIVVLPRFVGEPLVASQRLEAGLPGWLIVVAPVSILFSTKEHLRPAARACIDFVADRLKQSL